MNNTTYRIGARFLFDIKSTLFPFYSGKSVISATKTMAILILTLNVTSCATDVGFTVNTTQDLHDPVPGDGICGGNQVGTCSLRAAIEETNEVNPDQRVLITIPEGLYELSQEPDLDLDDAGHLRLKRGRVTLSGAGQDETIIDALNLHRVLSIFGADNKQILIEKMTFRRGRVLAEVINCCGQGGAVYIENVSTAPYLITFSDTAIEDSRAERRGGGIYAKGSGTLNIINSQIVGNRSVDFTEDCSGSIQEEFEGGGGIYAEGPTVNIIQSEIRDNCGTYGGGVRLLSGNNHLILRSTIADNHAPDAGGGILFNNNAGGRIEDSTITGNRVTNDYPMIVTDGSAAGLYVEDGTLTIINTTIVENIHEFSGENFTGGLRVDGGSVNLRNTVLADNSGGGLNEEDCIGLISSSGGNFFGDGVACTFIGLPSDIVNGGNPLLGNLVNNGGTTRTMRPSFGSPLIDSGIDGCESIDQRGLDFPAPLGDGCDIGAIER